ncbi:hypothetical protein HAX54_025284 [Datura stramonium]|uniref:Aminotransferase class V domain-containing protein n=1 Tax=Datura stramonium TaxID=4076 RepID=A0ABS8S6Z7_DATST|nr:hypothetical protein [Datura stramonium]
MDHEKNYNIETSSSTASSIASHDDFRSRIDSFHARENGVSKSDSIEKKLSWLGSQIIGANVDFETPFGKRRLTYADHTASGRCLHYIENYIIDNVLPFYGNSHTSDSYVGYQTTKLVHEAAAYVKKCLGGGEEDVIFYGSGSTAAIKRLQEVMGISIPSILRKEVLKKCFHKETKERWVVFVGPYEHHSNILSWRQSLAEVVEIGLDQNGLVDMEALRVQLELHKSTNRPLLGSFSACSNVLALIQIQEPLLVFFTKMELLLALISQQAPNAKIDMRSREIDGYDAVFLSPHKLLGGPGTPGVLMKKALYRLISSPPSTCGGGTVNFVTPFNEKDTLYVDNIEEREDAGTPPIIQKVRTALAFWVKEFISHKPRDKLCFLFSSIPALTLHQVISNVEESELYLWGETGNKRDKPLHGPFVAKLLNDLFGIQARGGCACAGPYGHSLVKLDEPHSLALRDAIKMGYSGVKPGSTRASFPYYMSQEEFVFILEAVEFISFYGQRY